MIQLHTRSLKYGKVSSSALPSVQSLSSPSLQLRNGQLVTVPASLIRRLKSHFYTLPPPCGPQGVDVILGVNGYIWVCLGSADKTTEGNANSDGFENELVYSDKNDVSQWITHFPYDDVLILFLGHNTSIAASDRSSLRTHPDVCALFDPTDRGTAHGRI
jgi:hypothetical protein